MATISPTYTYLAATNRHSTGGIVVQWTPVTSADTCAAADIVDYADRSVQVSGTFDSATVKLQGSNDGTNFVDLTDPQGNAISKTAAALEAVMELTAYTKPTFSGGGASQSLTVTMLCRKEAK